MLKRKLRSESGVTLLMALLFFLLCALGSSVVLAAGSTASGRIAGLEQDQQAFYTVTSAAQVLQESIGEGEFTAVAETTVEAGGSSYPFTKRDYVDPVNPTKSCLLGNLMKNASIEVYNDGGTRKAYTDTLTIQPESDSDLFGTVKAQFTMDENYNISIVLALDDAELGNKYQCVVTSKASVTVDGPNISEVKDAGGNVVKTVTTIRTTVRWSKPRIEKNVLPG